MKKMVGESGMHATFYYLELVEVLHRPVEFHKRLQSMFKEGSEIIEKAILRELYGRLNLEFKEQRGFGFADYVDLAGTAFLANNVKVGTRDGLQRKQV